MPPFSATIARIGVVNIQKDSVPEENGPFGAEGTSKLFP
jgi:hypothetical protein